MALKCGIIGLTNTGKTTIFNCISNTKAQATRFAFSTNKSNIGIVTVPDPRMDVLRKLLNSAKNVPTTVEIVDIPGLTKGSSKGEGVGNSFLEDIRQCNALIHVLRCFDDEELPHIEGSVDPVRDIEIIEFELQVKDLEAIDKKIARFEKLAKSNDKDAKQGLVVLAKYKEHLENFLPIRTLDVSEEEKKHVRDLNLLTEKPVMFVCNVDESSAASGNNHSKAVIDSLKDENSEIIIVAGAIESEIAELTSEEDKLEFLSDLGLNEPGVNQMIRSAYSLLNLKTFFTAGPKEIHAWTIKNGCLAPRAAGTIHSDLERGFIRAEVMSYEDLVEYGSEAKLKEVGKLRVEGKTYEVQEGDILNIRFNV